MSGKSEWNLNTEPQIFPCSVPKFEGRWNNMELGQWIGVAIMVAMCVGLVAWVVYVMKKDKKDKG